MASGILATKQPDANTWQALVFVAKVRIQFLKEFVY